MKRLIIKQDNCINCGACAMVCSKRHYGVLDKMKSNIHVPEPEENTRLRVCVQCKKKVCLETCLKKAISVDPETGALIVDNEKCDGCKKCVLGCPNGAPWINNELKKMRVCDLCGGKPACVAACRHAALFYMELGEYVLQERKTVAEEGRPGQ